MLVLSLCIFLHYVLHHCIEEKENINDGFLDYSITEFWWNGTPGIDQTDRVTIQYEFMPTPPGHGKLLGPDGEELEVKPPPSPPGLGPMPGEEHTPPNISLPSLPFSVEKNTVASRTPPWHFQFPGLTPPPNFPSDYRFPTVVPESVEKPYSPSPTGPTPRGPSFTLPSVWSPKHEHPNLNVDSEQDQERDTTTTATTDSHESETSTMLMYNPLPSNALNWLQQIKSKAAVASTPTDKMPNIGKMFHYDYTTSAELFPPTVRRTARMTEVTHSELTVAATSAAGEYGSRRRAASHGADRRARRPARSSSSSS